MANVSIFFVVMVSVCYDKAYLIFSKSFDQKAKLLVRGVLVTLRGNFECM